jgi:hypothetical protein
MHSRAPEDNTSTISDDEIGILPSELLKKERNKETKNPFISDCSCGER